MASQSGFSVTIRFAASLPDVSLTIPDPSQTSVLSLIRQVREHLPTTHRSLRLRLIYAGRVLTPTLSIAAALRLPASIVSPLYAGDKGKGRAPVRPSVPPQNLYIHATFSDALKSTALDAERVEAESLDAALAPPSELPTDSVTSGNEPSGGQPSSQTAAGQRERRGTDASASNRLSLSRTGSIASQMPQGFDRLLAAGLSPMEVASLRSQFVAILAHTHTPDDMPGAAELRVLEERWLDNENEAGGARGSLGGAAAGESGLGDDDPGGLEDMLWGNVMGFFWPIGAVVWLMREEGVWTQRRRVAVVTGALVNLAFSVMRAAS